MKYSLKNEKYVFCKEGVYFAMTTEQVVEMKALCEEILNETGSDSTVQLDTRMQLIQEGTS
jgi:hypothetical protein